MIKVMVTASKQKFVNESIFLEMVVLNNSHVR